MSIEIKSWDGADRKALAQMFARAFAQDAAMVSLVDAHSEEDVERLARWFHITLGAWPSSHVMVARKGGQIAGGNIVSLGNEAPPLRFLVKWFWQQGWALGFRVPWQMVQHERKRLKHYSDKADLVIEFLAVDQAARGQGLARHLLEAAYAQVNRPTTIALETGNPQNVALYQHLGYQVVARYSDNGVDYVVLTKQLEKEE
ncbi:GNAT family N-acetyltransferase [Maritalea mediterranea]|uniref:GNAT family N-acetyltransferase n=1 Tax=Maritalea mediterranea TaxID=2909667 RepID=A0ABS9EC01_9HYPH|nr:GNAT family N-acetyltransferase [Maritalea mediterranea]MCF4099419.1 GNAT family N-acetyltransferase [Maritalea mediterranea]